MIDFKTIDDIAHRLGALLPEGLREAREELERNFRSTLRSGLSRVDLVTREEYDVQRAVLVRTREKLDALERTVDAIEARLEALGQPEH